MKRRRILQVAVGLPLASPMVGQTTYASSKPDELPRLETLPADGLADSRAKFCTVAQLAALRRLADLMLPAINGTPGATDAHAAEFLDFLLSESPADRQALYRNGLDTLNAEARQKKGKSFAEVDTASAGAILAPLRQPWTYQAPRDPFAAFLRAAKTDILTATVNSREWIAVVSTRNRNASGTSIYWSPIE